jgi:hypothetical protein
MFPILRSDRNKVWQEDTTLTATTTTATLNLGFLTVLQDAGGYLGGYLVTNQWGRPLEFRLSSAVQPNRVHKVLYAGTLQPYICADLIGKTLVEKTGTPVQLVVTDTPACLDLRLRLDVPVAWVASARRGENLLCRDARAVPDETAPNAQLVRDTLNCHASFPADAAQITDMLDRLIGLMDLTEPFGRIREAVSEARKMGVGNRA